LTLFKNKPETQLHDIVNKLGEKKNVSIADYKRFIKYLENEGLAKYPGRLVTTKPEASNPKNAARGLAALGFIHHINDEILERNAQSNVAESLPLRRTFVVELKDSKYSCEKVESFKDLLAIFDLECVAADKIVEAANPSATQGLVESALERIKRKFMHWVKPGHFYYRIRA